MRIRKKDDMELKKDLYKSRAASTKIGIVLGVIVSIVCFGILFQLITSCEMTKIDGLAMLIIGSIFLGGIGLICVVWVYRELKELRLLNMRLKIINKWISQQKHLK